MTCLGVFGDPRITGKPSGDDLREGKRTMLVAHAFANGDDGQRALLTQGLGAADLDAAGVEALRTVLRETGAVAAVEQQIEQRRTARPAGPAGPAPGSADAGGPAHPGRRRDRSRPVTVSASRVRGTNRSRRRGGGRAGRPVVRDAPGRRRPEGDRRRAGAGSRGSRRPDRARGLPVRHRPHGAHDAGPDQRRLRRHRPGHGAVAAPRSGRSDLPRPLPGWFAPWTSTPIRSGWRTRSPRSSVRPRRGGYLRFVEFVSTLYRLQWHDFIDRNFDSPLDLLTAQPGPARRAGGFRRMEPKVAQYLKDPRTRRVFSFQSMYAGLSPQQALALYCVISYMDCVAGVFHPRGGVHALPAAMARGCGSARRRVRLRPDGGAGRALGAPGDGGDQHRRRALRRRCGRDQRRSARGLPRPAGPAARAALRYSPSCFVLLAGSTRSVHRGSRITTSTSGAPGRRCSPTSSIGAGSWPTRACWSATPPARTAPSRRRGRQIYYVLLPTPNLDAGHRLGGLRPGLHRTGAGHPRVARLPRLRGQPRGCARPDPGRLGGAGHGARNPVRPRAHLRVRPDRCGRATAGGTTSFSRVPRPGPGSASPWHWCPGGWRPNGSSAPSAERSAARAGHGRCAAVP